MKKLSKSIARSKLPSHSFFPAQAIIEKNRLPLLNFWILGRSCLKSKQERLEVFPFTAIKVFKGRRHFAWK